MRTGSPGRNFGRTCTQGIDTEIVALPIFSYGGRVFRGARLDGNLGTAVGYSVEA